MELDLDRDFREFLESCELHDVRYLVVGGYAVAAHGHPRTTKDLDVWLAAERANAERVIRALDDFGFGSLELTPDDLLTPGTVIQLGYPPLRIDLLTSIDGVAFDDAYPDRVDIVSGDLRFAVIGRSALIANKIASGRPQDLADVDHLRRSS